MQALRVLDNAEDHERKRVPARTILFNIKICPIGKRRGIEGVDHNGIVHQFLEDSKLELYFSTKYYDVKCMAMHFKNVLELPQRAIVYQLPSIAEDPKAEEEDTNSVQNRSIVTITEVSNVPCLMVMKLSKSGNQLGRTLTVPANAGLKVDSGCDCCV